MAGTSSPTLRKLHNSLQGVLAGGALAASAPILAFTPFWSLMAAASPASAIYGTSLLLAGLALAAAAFVYGAVILAPARRGGVPWARNGRGAAGLSEEEFGGWAIKVNAALNFVLYVAIFLASLSLALTLIADYLPDLDHILFLGVAWRDLLGVGVAALITWLVNNRPRQIAYVYGPATGAALVLLWSLVVAAVLGPEPAPAQAFSAAASDSLGSTELMVNGLARLLAILVGLEVFATLEPAFDGNEAQRSWRAFGSMTIAVVTGLAMLLFVGPSVLALVDPAQPTSAMTQVMQQLLPAPLAWLGTVIALIALLTVAAASVQAVQNLRLGLRSRRFAPAFLAQRNRADVPDRPVYAVLALTAGLFLLLGAQEEYYLPLLVAGSLLLLMVVSWAAWRRARRESKLRQGAGAWVLPCILLVAALFVSIVGILVFIDGFLRGAWLYLLAVPVLYALFHFTRRKMGPPNPLLEELGRREGSMRGLAQPIAVRQVAVALDGSDFAERSLPAAAAISRLFDAQLALISVLPSRGVLRVLPKGRSSGNPAEAGQIDTEAYLSRLAGEYLDRGVRTDYYVAAGPVPQAINVLTIELNVDLLVMSTHGRSGMSRFMLGSNASALIQLLRQPVLLLRPQALARGDLPEVRRVLVTLDGSSFAERVLPWVQRVSEATGAEVLLLVVPEVPEPSLYGAMADAVDELRGQAEANARRYLERVSAQLLDAGLPVRSLVEGSRPATTILDVAERGQVDLIMLATHGRGGIDRLMLGSVADRVVHHSLCPVLLVPARDDYA